jgi:hypothetical protein
MTDADRARLERAKQHPAYQDAMARAPQDYAVPIALLAGFYLVIPFLYVAWMIGIASMGDVPIGETAFVGIMFLSVALPAIPFIWGVLRTWPLRALPPRHVFGIVDERLTRGPGKWVRVETLDGAALDLRLRLKAYLDSTGGAVAPGTVGVALCKGDQMVEWVAIPDVVPEAAPPPEPAPI